MNTIVDIINKWEETVDIVENLIAFSNPDEIMMAIMVSRKNQLIECIGDLKKIPKEHVVPVNSCRKKILSKELADKIVCRDELDGLNTGKRTGQRVAYYCKECKAWHTSTMTPRNPNLKL